MRCSSFKPLLDEYVDGMLSSRKTALVAAHLAGCAECPALLEELRVVDALLVTPRILEPAPNFTFKVMAEVRSLPRPEVHRGAHAFGVTAAYLAFAWAFIGAFFLFGDGTSHAAWTTLVATATHSGDAFNALAAATARFFGPNTFRVTAAMSALLAVDVVLASIVGAAVYLRRNRVAARVEIS
jgi:anti-sigma factor RsiW